MLPKLFAHRLVLLAVIALPPMSALAIDIHGAGATFPSSVYQAWAVDYGKTHATKVSYQATGSGDGVHRIEAREVDFGASDSALTMADLEKHGLIQIPSAVGGIVPVVNLRGVADGELKLSGEVLADIMRGAITQWSDRRIASLNPELTLPRTAIVRVVRAEKSGTTDGFTRYLAATSTDWATQVGSGQKVSWPGSVTAVDGNDGVAQAVAALPNAIGYVSFDRVARHKLASVRLRNRAGVFVAPSAEAFRSAVQESGLNRRGDETATLLDQPGAQSWPLTITTYLLVDARPKTAAGARAALQFIYWALLNGDALVRSSGLTPLPDVIQSRLVERFAHVRPQDGQPLNFYGY